MAEWIPVSERLPVHGEHVWLFAPHFGIAMGSTLMRFFSNDVPKWIAITSERLYSVTHWQPVQIPEPPPMTEKIE